MTIFVKLVRLVFPLKEIKNITEVFYVDNIYIVTKINEKKSLKS